MEYMSIWRFGGKGEGHEAWAAMYIESRKAGYQAISRTMPGARLKRPETRRRCDSNGRSGSAKRGEIAPVTAPAGAAEISLPW